MPPEGHALLSASSAARWIHCPPSARLTEHMPDTSSEYAEAGRLAHEIAEFKARAYFLEPIGKREYSAGMKRYKNSPYYDNAMDANTEAYLDYLKELTLSYPAPPTVALETRVDYSDTVPGGFGTADCLLVGSGRMDVVDYKNGAGVLVEAEENPQMMLYAAGALRLYAPVFGEGIRTIHLSIVQPNAGGIRDWCVDTGELLAWLKGTAAPAAALAYEGKGEYAAGDWCRFCKARAQCTARAKHMLALEPLVGCAPAEPGTEPPPENLLTDEEVGDILTRAKGLAAWVAELEAYALRAVLAGREVAGWKAVEGRGSRDWAGGPDAAFEQLKRRGVDEALLYERKPVSVAGLEKAIGKKPFAEAAEGLWTKTAGKPALVPSSDKRPAYNAAQAAFEKIHE